METSLCDRKQNLRLSIQTVRGPNLQFCRLCLLLISFTQGFAHGLGITEPVNSPTFTIVQVYEGGRLPFYHFDVYRIGDVEEMDEVGFDEYVMGEGVSLIEWANLIEEILPERRTEIIIEKDLQEGFEYRRITIEER